MVMIRMIVRRYGRGRLTWRVGASCACSSAAALLVVVVGMLMRRMVVICVIVSIRSRVRPPRQPAWRAFSSR